MFVQTWQGCGLRSNIMKVVPDPDRILPGYLYAFLSSKFGVPLVVGGTYGAIIQHIEPHHIANLPVPRLGDELETQVHKLIKEAHSWTSIRRILLRQPRMSSNDWSAQSVPRSSGRRSHLI